MPRSRTDTPDDWEQICTDFPPDLIAKARKHAKEGVFPPVDIHWVIRDALAKYLAWDPMAARTSPAEPPAT
jgi:hypothetical protein